MFLRWIRSPRRKSKSARPLAFSFEYDLQQPVLFHKMAWCGVWRNYGVRPLPSTGQRLRIFASEVAIAPDPSTGLQIIACTPNTVHTLRAVLQARNELRAISCIPLRHRTSGPLLCGFESSSGAMTQSEFEQLSDGIAVGRVFDPEQNVPARRLRE